MAYALTQSTPSTGDAAMRAVKDALVASTRWEVKASGDGASAYSSSGDVISADSGANSFANYTSGSSSAWLRLRMVGTTREVLFIRGSASTTWTIKYSLLGFSGGSPSATAAPTATDSQTKHSAAQLFGTDGTYQLTICAEDAAPAYWSASARLTASAFDCKTIFGVWPLATGSYPTTPTADDDPYVVTSYYQSPITCDHLNMAGGLMAAWSRPGLGSAVWSSGYTPVPYSFRTGTLHEISSKTLMPTVPVCLNNGSYHGPKGYLRDVRLCLDDTAISPNGTHGQDGSDYFYRCGPLWLRANSTPTT